MPALPYLGTFDNTEKCHRTKVFVLYVSRLAEDFEDKDIRKRKWCSVDEAQKLLCAFKPIQAKYLVALKQTIEAAATDDNVTATNEWILKKTLLVTEFSTQYRLNWYELLVMFKELFNRKTTEPLLHSVAK